MTVYQENLDIKMDYVIEPLSVDFVDHVAEIEKECFSIPFKKEDILSYLNESYWRFFVARDKNEILGYISFTIILDEISICNVAVSSKYRKIGIGKALVSFLLDYAKKNGVCKLFLEVRESNISAISLYEKFGFERVGISKNHYSMPKENALLMNLNFNY